MVNFIFKFWQRDRGLNHDVLRLLLLLLPAFLLLLGLRPLSVPDEGRYPEIAHEMLLTGDYITPKINGIVFLDKPALYYWLEAASFHLFGFHTWSVRLMPALFGVLGVVIVFVTTYRLFSRRAAAWSAVMLATSPLYFLSSQYADMNLEVAVFVTAALCLFLLGRLEVLGTRRRRNFFWAAWCAIGLGVLTKGLIGFVFPAMIIGAWVVFGSRWRELRHWYFPSGMVLMLSLCAPWVVLVQQKNPQFLHHFFIYQQFQRFSGGGFNNEFPFWFYVPVVIGGVLPWSVWLVHIIRNRLLVRGGLTVRNGRSNIATGERAVIADARQLLLLWPLLIFIFFTIPASKVVGYILPVLPPLAILLGDYIDRCYRQNKNASEGVKSTVFLPWLLRATPFMPVVGGLLIGAAIFTAAVFDKNGISPLAEILSSQSLPTDLVVSYHNYYQDLPMYLRTEKPLVVVDDWGNADLLKVDNWRREFYLGLREQPEAKEWLIDEAHFSNLFNTQSRVFVLARARDEEHLSKTYGLKVVGRQDRHVLMVRQALVSQASANPIIHNGS